VSWKAHLSRRTFVLVGLGQVSFAAVALAGWRALQSQRWRDVRWQAAEVTVDGERLRAPGGAEYRLNRTGLRLWHLCDGRHTGEELIADLTRHASISRERAVRDVHGFLAAVAREGLVVPV